MNTSPRSSLLYQLRVPKNAQVLRDRRLRHLEDLDQRMHVELTMVAMGKLLDDANPTFVAESAKGLRELFGDDNSCGHAYVDIFELVNISIDLLNNKGKRRSNLERCDLVQTQ